MFLGRYLRSGKSRRAVNEAGAVVEIPRDVDDDRPGGTAQVEVNLDDRRRLVVQEV